MYMVMTEGKNLKGMQKNSVISPKTKEFLKEKYSKCDFSYIMNTFQSLEKSLLQDKEIRAVIEFKEDEFAIKHLIRYKDKKIYLKTLCKDLGFEAKSDISLKNKADEKYIDTILCGIVSRLFAMQELLAAYIDCFNKEKKRKEEYAK